MDHVMNVIVFWITIFMAIPLFKNGFLQLTAWNHQRSIAITQKEIAFLQRLHASDRAVMLFLAKYAFMIAAVICVNLMFTSIGTNALGMKIYVMELFVSGMTGYAMAVYMAGTMTRLEKYDETIASLEKKLDNLRGQDPEPLG
jgi:hypothetical protein